MKENFIVFPAIDLRRGLVVRLREGDPARQTVYSPSPADTARNWIDAGAAWLHVINLDGAFDQPDAANRNALQSILNVVHDTGRSVQFGGGLRSLRAVGEAFEMGVNRVVLSTLAVERPALITELVRQYGSERVAVSLDARDGKVQVHGWQSATTIQAIDLAQQLRDAGLAWLVYTDISRDGLQVGLNLDSTHEIAQATGLNVIASGGVKSQADIDAARRMGLAGVITGRALYEGAFNLNELFRDQIRKDDIS
ncbi:MAG: 1-(5-phosphoribosyl)-5-[(5-phosphoribosylamino)methylideneamino]imidazole-4-carboxamide isomerase [Anaerolineaceae bacterium]|nr:1-(5-phosphoribosyl)-5-[(5-phosphoribosylamino)methylideneamino]imidazole-4-carboxamide isomerase [Anaerolineaceae bacterium]